MRYTKYILGGILLLSCFPTSFAQGDKLSPPEVQRAKASAAKVAKLLGLDANLANDKVDLYEGEIYVMGPIMFTLNRDASFKALSLKEFDAGRAKQKPVAKSLDEKGALAKGKSAILKVWNVRDLATPKVRYINAPPTMTNCFIGGFVSASTKARYAFVIAAESGKLISVQRTVLK